MQISERIFRDTCEKAVLRRDRKPAPEWFVLESLRRQKERSGPVEQPDTSAGWNELPEAFQKIIFRCRATFQEGGVDTFIAEDGRRFLFWSVRCSPKPPYHWVIDVIDPKNREHVCLSATNVGTYVMEASFRKGQAAAKGGGAGGKSVESGSRMASPPARAATSQNAPEGHLQPQGDKTMGIPARQEVVGDENGVDAPPGALEQSDFVLPGPKKGEPMDDSIPF